ncbi:hypothetical protein BDV12DRAFT_179470 [Aspergillus spectabilis]
MRFHWLLEQLYAWRIRPRQEQLAPEGQLQQSVPNSPDSRKIWGTIFQDNKWLDKLTTELNAMPVLIGPNLHEIHLPPSQRKQKDVFAVLCSADISGDVRYTIPTLFKSLREGCELDLRSSKLYFKDINVTISIIEPLHAVEWVGMELQDLKRLVQFNDGQLQSRYSFFPEAEVKLVSHHDIRGVGGTLTNMDSIDPILALSLRHQNKELQLKFERKDHDIKLLAGGGNNRGYLAPIAEWKVC